MRTTLVIDDQLMRTVKALAAERRETLSAVVDALLRQGLAAAWKPDTRLVPLPHFSAGEMLVDPADRDALYAAMEGDVPDVRR